MNPRTIPPRRVDWKAERDRIDLARVATDLLGPPQGRRGGQGRRLWWSCPLGTHEDRNPSFSVDSGKSSWKCHGCGEHGDAASLVMRLQGISFPEALARLVGRASLPPRAVPPPATPSGLPGPEALALVEDAVARLWSAEGASVLAELTDRRRLTPETIRAARLGWTPGVSLMTSEARFFSSQGVVIPWFDGERLALTKIRQPEGREPKYAEAFRDRPAIYPGCHGIRPGLPLVVVEGEFDALLLGQELEGLAAVVTLGSASARPDISLMAALLAAAPWFIATDADAAGDKASGRWPVPRSRRVRPPDPFKDWTEARQGGVNLRRWWSDRLGGVTPPLFTWEDLSAWRWGSDPDPPEGRAIDIPIDIPTNNHDDRPPGEGCLEDLLACLTGRGMRLDGRIVRPTVAVGTVTGRVAYQAVDGVAIQTLAGADRERRITPLVAGRRFVRADYGQIEPRILLEILRRRDLIGWTAGEDLYRDLIADASIGRDDAKVAVNKIINGGRPGPGATGRLAEFIRAAESYRAEVAAAAKVKGSVRTLAGRKILLAHDEDNHGGKAVNRVVQGTAADIFNRAAVRLSRKFQGREPAAAVAFLLFDELWVEADPNDATISALIRSELEAAAAADGVVVPVRFDEEPPPPEAAR